MWKNQNKTSLLYTANQETKQTFNAIQALSKVHFPKEKTKATQFS